MSAPLWDAQALAEATGGRFVGEPPAAVNGLSIDTRTLEAGDAFFAIRGEQFDGHHFAAAAAKAGAGILVVAQGKLAELGDPGAPLLAVDDVLASLGRLAEAARARSRAKIVAVTGSVGKTTTKEALRHALEASGTVHASAASFNNHWGVPLSLARLPTDARFAVFEIGMNHPDEIRPLVKLVRPHVAIVTLIAPAHLGHFRDLDAIADAKAEIFEGLVSGGVALINADDPQRRRLLDAARAAGVSAVRFFGEAGDADYRLLGYEADGEGAHLSAAIGEEHVAVRLAAPGRHIAQNVLAVLGAAALCGADPKASASALSSWRAGRGRGSRHRLGSPDEAPILLLDESYNANPASMRAALGLLKDAAPAGQGRRIAVLGDMLELGTHAPALHAGLAEPLTQAGVDLALLAGPEMRGLAEALRDRVAHEWHANVNDLRASLEAHMRPGDVVVVKASKSIGFSKLVEQLLAAHATPEPAGESPAAGAPSRNP